MIGLHHQEASCKPECTRSPSLLGASRAFLKPLTTASPVPNSIRRLHARCADVRCRAASAAGVQAPLSVRDKQRADDATSSQQEIKLWQWTKCWYPVQSVEALDPKVPQHIDLLGRGLVVWGDSSGGWFCVEDRCPHRLAPLSEGRVEGGHIQCCYHGWTFDGAGRCSCIPQISDPKAAATACGSKRAAVAAFPTRVSHGLLWVWPQPGEGAAAEAAAVAVTAQPEGVARTPWLVRDMPVRYDTLMENLLDPSHVPFAHHGVQGNRNRVNTSPITLLNFGESGYTVQQDFSLSRPGLSYTVSFKAPCTVEYELKPGVVFLNLIAVPTKPGWTRLFNNLPADFPNMPLPLRLLMKLRTANTAINHATDRNAVLDGDTYLLHVAERELPVTKGIGTQWVQACYMPASQDIPVINWRKWIDQFGGTVPTCTPADHALMPPLMPKHVALDRYEQHTKHCVHCRAAVKQIDAACVAAQVVGVLAAFTAVAKLVVVSSTAGAAASAAITAAPAAMTAASAAITAFPGSLLMPQLQAIAREPWVTVSLAVVALCVLLFQKLQQFRRKFFYEDYVHATK